MQAKLARRVAPRPFGPAVLLPAAGYVLAGKAKALQVLVWSVGPPMKRQAFHFHISIGCYAANTNVKGGFGGKAPKGPAPPKARQRKMDLWQRGP